MKSITLPGTLESLKPLAEFVHTVAKEAGFDQQTAYRLHLAVDEIATNTVMHGYAGGQTQGEIFLSAEILPAQLRINLEDSAAVFDPTQRASAPDLSADIETRTIGGLGILLAQKNVDQFLYQRVGDRNRVIFVLKRPSIQH